jgi:hypothetical protein
MPQWRLEFHIRDKLIDLPDAPGDEHDAKPTLTKTLR